MSTGAAGDWVDYKSVFTVPEETQNREIALLLGEGAVTTNAEIWVDDIKVEEYGPHSGGYQADKRVIDFNNYKVCSDNSWHQEDGTLYFSTKTESGNTYLHYEVNDGSAGNWYASHAMNPSVDGMSISKSDAEISYEDAYSDSASLKLNLKANTQSAAELKNDCYIDAKLGQTYTVSFMYKA